MIFIGDPHVDSKVGTQIVKDIITPKLNKIIDLINKEYRVVFLGDYFNPSNPNNLSRKFLSDIFKKITTPKILLIGNNYRDKNGSNCLASISSFLNANDIIVEDTYEENNICYISYTLDFQHIVNIIKTTKCKYIVGHFSFGYMKDEKIMRGELEYDKSYDIAYNNLGVIYLDDLGRVQKAIELFTKSIELNPNYALAHFNLARAITIRGDQVEAAKLYQIAQDINKVTNEMDPQDIVDKINDLFES